MAIFKQADGPLFKDFIWAQPERPAGIAVIVGGNERSLAAPLAAFTHCTAANLKAIVILPDCLKKTLGKVNEEIMFAPSTPSGSLAAGAAKTILPLVKQHSCLFIAGDLSSNEETRRLARKLVDSCQKLKIILGETAADLLAADSWSDNLHLFATQKELLALARARGAEKTFSHAGSEAMGAFLTELKLGCSLTAPDKRWLWSKLDGQVCATSVAREIDLLELAVYCTRYLIDNPRQNWKALVSGCWQATQSGAV